MNRFYNYDTLTFDQVFPDFDTFNNEYQNCGIEPALKNSDGKTIKNLYALLLSRYANWNTVSYDKNRFILNLFAIVFQYGPTWEKDLEIQKDLRNLTKDDIMKGATAIHNHAYNPETAPSTQSTEELNYINEQSVTKYKKNPLEGYAQLAALLERDVTGYFLKRFEPLFTNFPPFKPVYYITEEGDKTI